MHLHNPPNPPPQIILTEVTIYPVLCFTKTINGMVNIVVLEYSVYVLQGLAGIQNQGVYGAAITKKSW